MTGARMLALLLCGAVLGAQVHLLLATRGTAAGGRELTVDVID